MSVTPAWPPPFPFPPTPSENWNATAKGYLAALIRGRLRGCSQANVKESDVAYLVEKLATPKAVRRFYRVQKYEQHANQQEISYLEWLDRVVHGYMAYSAKWQRSREEGHENVMTLIHRIVSSTYVRLAHRHPPPDLREELAARLSLALLENYFYDTELEPWLRQTAQNIIKDDIRKIIPLIDDIELHPELPQRDRSGEDWLQAHIQREMLLEAIRQISHRRYRVILLLIYLFDFTNGELAAFFGVSVPEATTWRSRALQALRKKYPPDERPK